MAAGTWKNNAQTDNKPADDRGKATGYRFHVLITKDADATFSVVAMNLPGVGSCADTEEEAIANFKEAALGTLESYRDAGKDIPWKDSSCESIPFGAQHKWIIVHA